MRELDNKIVGVAKDRRILEEVIAENEYFILRCASSFSNRYITKSDDEWSIALHGFVQAVEEYELKKGSFLAFAKLIIRRRLIDYLRKSVKYNSEITVDPTVFNSDSSVEEEDVAIQLAVAKQVSVQKEDAITLEIAAMNEVLEAYGFTFMDLTSCSPHATKTKSACAKAVAFVLENPVIIEEIKNTKQLPLKIIEKNKKVPRKILERHRKYIIAAIEILSGEYPKLAEYLHFIREEMSL